MSVRPSRVRLLLGLAVSLAALSATPRGPAIAQETAVAVEPADLIRRADLVGKLISVDDRIRFFQNHPQSGYDELYLKRTPIPFKLPTELRPRSVPRAPAVVVQGRLTKEHDQLAVEVTSLSLQSADPERFDKGVAALGANDYETRKAWAAWAEKRADDFKDDALKKRSQTVKAEALRIEAASRRGAVDAADEWLKLADEGRRRKVPEPDPSALAHRAFRAKLADASSPDELKTVQAGVERFFPEAAKDQAVGRIALGQWGDAYAKDPTAYRKAPPELRKPLDRRLWADVVCRRLELRAARDLQATLDIVAEAETLVPERPELIAKLVDQAQEQARTNLASLRYAEVKTIGSLLRDRAGKPEAAVEFNRDWLKSQRDRLSGADAEGRVALASRYEELLQDPEAARELLEKAWKIAPGSREVAEAFQVRGFRRVGDDWIKDAPTPAADAETETESRPPAARPDQGLRGKTPEEVRNALATEPTSRSYVATKGRLVEQWIFLDTRQTRYVNFARSPGDLKPHVISDYFLPR